MMEYLSISVIALMQWFIYFQIDKKVSSFPKWLILAALLLGQLFVFPKLLIYAYGLTDVPCGMPILGVHLLFIIPGGSLNIVTHTIYYFHSRRVATKRTL